MFNVEFSSNAKKFLRDAEKQIAARILDCVDSLAKDPFPHDVKRVVNRKEKIFRVRVGKYRIQYCVLYEKNLIFVTDIDIRDRAY